LVDSVFLAKNQDSYFRSRRLPKQVPIGGQYEPSACGANIEACKQRGCNRGEFDEGIRRGLPDPAICVPPGVLLQGCGRKAQEKNSYSLVHVGSSHSDTCWEILLQKLSAIESKTFEIHVFGSQGGYERFKPFPQNVSFVFHGSVPEREIYRRSSEFDAAIFFWDHFSKNRLKYSVSTKLTTYLQMMLPMIALISPLNEGHNLFSYGIGLDVKEMNEAKLIQFLNQEEFDLKLQQYVDNFFNQQRMLEEFREKCCLFGN
jgi:hypothetical protein